MSIAPKAFGSSQADLVFTPVTPCRIIDTRVAGGPITAGSQRNFLAAGGPFTSQGGSNSDCGVPFGPATAVVVNLIAVGPAGGGDLRAFPFGAAVPLASVLNYANVPSLNIANDIVLKICDVTVSTCSFDFTVQADVNSTNLVGDVLGYFAAPVSTALSCLTQTASVGVASGAQINFPPGLVSPPCPAGYTLTGGGNRYTGNVTGFFWWNSHPNGASWVTAGSNQTGAPVTVDVFCICCRIPGR